MRMAAVFAVKSVWGTFKGIRERTGEKDKDLINLCDLPFSELWQGSFFCTVGEILIGYPGQKNQKLHQILYPNMKKLPNKCSFVSYLSCK